MNKNSIIQLIVIIVCLHGKVIGATQSTTDFIKQENNALANSNPIRSEGVIFLKIFNGVIPLPARYVLNISGNDIIEMNSNISLSTPGFGIGLIRTGRHQSFVKRYTYDSKQYEIVEIQSEVTGLQVTKYIHMSADINSPDSMFTVVIDDGNEFIMITDQNPTLWEAALKGFKKLY